MGNYLFLTLNTIKKHTWSRTPHEKGTKTQESITYKRTKSSALSKQVITRLQYTDKTAWGTRNINNKRASKPLIDHLNYGTWGDDVLACGYRDIISKKYIFSSGGHVIQPSQIFWSIFLEGIMGNISVKLFWIQTSISGELVVSRYFLSRALTVPLFSRAEPFQQFW